MSISGAENQSCPSAGMQRGLVLTQTANKDQVKKYFYVFFSDIIIGSKFSEDKL